MHRKIGIYGGCFDPVHNGHVRLVESLLGAGLVDEVWVVVAKSSPFKGKSEMGFEERSETARDAFGGIDGVTVVDVARYLDEPTRTIDVINTLEVLTRGENEFVLVLGTDAWNGIEQFKDYDLIVENYPVIVARRPGYELSDGDHGCGSLKVIDVDVPEVSSTEVRNRLHTGESVDGLVPEGLSSKLAELFGN
jgi:nicotinate-nucleotide adenylyltransferase